MIVQLPEITEKKIQTIDGIEIKDKKAIVRIDTGAVLGVVGDNYRIVRHQEVINSVSSILGDLGLEEKTRTICKQGSVLFSKFYSDKKYEGEIKVGDIVKFGIEVFNSYNGTLPVGIILIAERLKCTNGMVVPETLSKFTVRHSNRLNLEVIKQRMKSILEGYPLILENYRQWETIKVEESRVQKFFEDNFGNRLQKNLFEIYIAEKEGNSIWDLYNVLTYWNTHELKTKKNNQENIRLLQWNKELDFTVKLQELVNSN